MTTNDHTHPDVDTPDDEEILTVSETTGATAQPGTTARTDDTVEIGEQRVDDDPHDVTDGSSVGAASGVSPNPPPPVPVLRGPSVGTVILGLVAVVIGVTAWVQHATTLRIDWSQAGPAVVIGFGVIVLVLGAMTLRDGRRQP